MERESYGRAPSQFVEWYRRAQSDRPLIVAIHGGYWRARHDLAHLGPLCNALASQGLRVVSIEYRRLGEPGGGWPGTFEDVTRAIDSVVSSGPQRSEAPPRVVLLGHSAGGQLALWAASRRPGPQSLERPSQARFRGVVGLAPVSDLAEASRRDLSQGVVRELLGGAPEDVPQRYKDASPVELVPLGLPTVVLHGTADTDVPYELGPAYVERARAAGDAARLVTLRDAGHFDLIDPESRFWAQVVEAITSVS